MIKKNQTLVVCLMILLFSAQILGQDKEKVVPEILKVDTNLVSIDVAVVNKAGGKNLANLNIEDFVVFEDGVRQKVENFATLDVPLNVVLMIDTSGSTKDDIALIKKAAKRFLIEMRDQDRIAVVEFNEKITVLEVLTEDKDKIEHAIDFLQLGSGTSFYDSIQIGIDEVLKNIEGRKSMIVLTDGVDSVGGSSYEDILTEVEKSGVAIYFLEINTEANSEEAMMRDCLETNSYHFSRKQLRKYLKEYADGADESLYQDHCEIPRLERMQINRRLYESARKELRELATQSGGRVYPCNNLSEIVPAYSQIAAELRTLYSIGYYPKNDKRDGKWRKLRVEIKRSGLSAKAKPGYRALDQ